MYNIFIYIYIYIYMYIYIYIYIYNIYMYIYIILTDDSYLIQKILFWLHLIEQQGSKIHGC